MKKNMTPSERREAILNVLCKRRQDTVENLAHEFGVSVRTIKYDIEELTLIPEWFRTEILQEKLDGKGVLVEKSDVTESVKFALLFEFDGDVNAIRHVLYSCSASRPSIASETKEDTIEPGTETLSVTADPRSDGLVKARTGDTTDATAYANWYKTVYIPEGETPEKASEE